MMSRPDAISGSRVRGHARHTAPAESRCCLHAATGAERPGPPRAAIVRGAGRCRIIPPRSALRDVCLMLRDAGGPARTALRMRACQCTVSADYVCEKGSGPLGWSFVQPADGCPACMGVVPSVQKLIRTAGSEGSED